MKALCEVKISVIQISSNQFSQRPGDIRGGSFKVISSGGNDLPVDGLSEDPNRQCNE
jgi:hypothetical protein